MSKDFKQKERIKFMHGLLSYEDVCIGLKKKWNKINFNWGFYKAKKNKQLEHELDMQAMKEVENIDYES